MKDHHSEDRLTKREKETIQNLENGQEPIDQIIIKPL